MVPRLQAVCHCGSHGFITLNKGGAAIVDPTDLAMFSGQNWQQKNGYAVRTIYGKPSGERFVRMHRVILGDVQITDHINGDRSDNRRANLRAVDPSESCANRKLWGSVRFKGVDFHPDGHFRARIQYRGKTQFIGYFPTAEDAARAYDAKAIELHGEFAKTNAALGLLSSEAA